jgi:hypothetical protein
MPDWLSSLLSQIAVAIGSGVVSAGLWSKWDAARRRRERAERNASLYKPFEGVYDAELKGGVHYGTVRIRVDGDVFHLARDHEQTRMAWDGRVLMRDGPYPAGWGFYQHRDKQAYGSLQLQILNDHEIHQRSHWTRGSKSYSNDLTLRRRDLCVGH